MTNYYVFNGDADGICAAQQMYLNKRQNFEPITGVKRDLSLLKKIEKAKDSQISVFDIAVEKNLPYMAKLVEQNCHILWFDHHISHDIPKHVNIEYNIQTDVDINTSLIVAEYLNDSLSPWAIVGLFGDNMSEPAIRSAKSIGLNEAKIQGLKRMGELLNYNAYGSTIDDLHFHPADILEKMRPYDEPFAFIKNETLIDELAEGHREDFQEIEQIEWLTPNIVRLPDEKWARRVVGDFAYQLVRKEPNKDFAVLLTLGESYQVGIRASATHDYNAGDFCLTFPTGGGRVKAAGINVLPRNFLDDFIRRFNNYFIK